MILLESSQEDGAQVSLSLIPDSLELVNQAYGELDVTLAEEPEEFLDCGPGRRAGGDADTGTGRDANAGSGGDS